MSQPDLTPAGREALAAARQEAERLRHGRLGSEHLLLGLLAHADPATLALLAGRGLDPAAVRAQLEQGLSPGNAAPEDEITWRPRALRVLDTAARAAEGPVGPGHLLEALLGERSGPVARVLGGGSAARRLGGSAEGGQSATDDRGEAGPAEPPRREPRSAQREARGRGRTEETPPARPPRERRKRERAAEAQAPVERAPLARERYGPPEDDFDDDDIPHGPEPSSSSGRTGLIRKLLLVAVPVSWALAWTHQPPWLVFAAACIGVLPLAAWMGEATEHLAARTGPTLGGLLNATFGNAAELIIAIAALRAGLVDLVKASITGSILGNLLLILGLSLVAAGRHKPVFRFNRTAAGMSAGMLALAVVGLGFPALFHALHPEATAGRELRLSELVAIILVLTYGASLWFSLRTHHRVFGGDPHPTTTHVWGVPLAVGVLLAATAATAVQAEILVHATEAVTAGSGISELFLGLIVIPLIGNAAEHAAAVIVARKGQVDLALQIALGSSTQIALLVAPVLVFIGLAFGSGMNLVFTPFEVLAVGMSTVVVAIITLDGESHWFEGVQLLAVYALVATAAFFI